MKIKQYVIMVILILMSSTVFASRRLGGFVLRNYSSKEIRVNVEYWEKPIIAIYDNPLTQEEINGILFRHNYFKREGEPVFPKTNETFIPITHFINAEEENILERYNDSLDIVEYAYNERIDRLPFMIRMRSIFKKLEIICDDGKRVITLDNLGEQIVKKTVARGDGAWFILEIFDYDLEGKPAAEW